MFNSVSTRRAWSNHLRVWCPVWARERFRISPTRFLAECCKGQLNQGSFVLLYFRLSTFSDLYWACLSVFSCTVLLVSISQVIGWPKWHLYCVEWGVKLYSHQPSCVLSIAQIGWALLLVRSVRSRPCATVGSTGSLPAGSTATRLRGETTPGSTHVFATPLASTTRLPAGRTPTATTSSTSPARKSQVHVVLPLYYS